MNYIIEKTSKKVLWKNTHSGKLVGNQVWAGFLTNQHEAIFAPYTDLSIGEVFPFDCFTVIDGVCMPFEAKRMFLLSNPNDSRIVFNFREYQGIDKTKWTSVEPIQNETRTEYLSYQVFDENAKTWNINQPMKDAHEKKIFNEEIDKKLHDIDMKSIRALRDNDMDWIANYKSQAQALRAQRK